MRRSEVYFLHGQDCWRKNYTQMAWIKTKQMSQQSSVNHALCFMCTGEEKISRDGRNKYEACTSHWSKFSISVWLTLCSRKEGRRILIIINRLCAIGHTEGHTGSRSQYTQSQTKWPLVKSGTHYKHRLHSCTLNPDRSTAKAHKWLWPICWRLIQCYLYGDCISNEKY